MNAHLPIWATKDLQHANGTPLNGHLYFVWNASNDPTTIIMHNAVDGNLNAKHADVQVWKNWCPAIT